METLINLLNIITGLLGLITVTIITIRYKSNRVINVYLIFIFIIQSIKFLINGFVGLNFFWFLTHFDTSYFTFFSIGIPALYLYFKNIVADTRSYNAKELKHFILPLALGFCNIFLDKFYVGVISSTYIFYTIFMLFLVFYTILTFQFLKKNVWSRKTELYNVDQQNNLIIKWTLFLFLFASLIALRLLISLFLCLITNTSNSYGQNYQWISAILLDFIFIKILSSPKILYGYNSIYKYIKTHKDTNFILRDFWIVNPKEIITNTQDIILKEKISRNISTYLQDIETLVLRYEILRNPMVSVNDIAHRLDIPKSHVTFVFKYHSKISFTEFKKTIRIYDAIQLIEDNYLKSNTLESLATKVGFSSYNPFFITFKDVTGTTPQIYNKEHMNP